MTALRALAVPGAAERDTPLHPLPWRRMAWVTWRQHRLALGVLAALPGALSICVWVAGVHLHHAYAAARACHPASSTACEELVGRFNGMEHFLASGYVLQAMPALIGAFVGAPLLARELETGSFRYAWTQGFGPWRWTLAKLVALGVVVTAAVGAITVLFSWYYQPYFAGGNQALSLTEASPLAGGLFALRGVALAAWTLAAFAIGALAGMLIRRVVPAILATLAAYAALAIATGTLLRQHYLTALLTSKLDVPGSAWIISQRWTTRAGQPVSLSLLGQVLQNGAPQLAGKGGVPKSLGSWQYLVQHGYTLWSTYQPAGRFWTFQWIEGGWLLALSALLIAATVWLAHLRGALPRREHAGPGANRSRPRRRLARGALTAGAILAVGIAVAGCGGGSSSSGVAHLSSSASAGSPASGGGASSPANGESTEQQLLAYARCMRSHGVPNFPDPSGGGAITKQAAVRAFKAVSNAQAQAAQTACEHLQPNGGQPSRAELAQHLGDLLAFAGCIRTHGIPNFPDPTSSGQLTHGMLASAGVNLHRAAVLQAADACVGVTHGALTKAAVARFAAGH
jgi:ABC-type transport system involved in multi-copper enzyme maturation permease subunit